MARISLVPQRKEFYELLALLFREARANADMLQRA